MVVRRIFPHGRIPHSAKPGIFDAATSTRAAAGVHQRTNIESNTGMQQRSRNLVATPAAPGTCSLGTTDRSC
nr:hypothetical protein CFP56_25785 [Quercus suber]